MSPRSSVMPSLTRDLDGHGEVAGGVVDPQVGALQSRRDLDGGVTGQSATDALDELDELILGERSDAAGGDDNRGLEASGAIDESESCC